MERRSFLKGLGAFIVSTVAASTELDPDKILWVPGQKTFFLPPKPFIPEPQIAVPPPVEEPELAITLADDRELQRVLEKQSQSGLDQYAHIDTGRFSISAHVAGGFSSKDLVEAKAYADHMAKTWTGGQGLRHKR